VGSRTTGNKAGRFLLAGPRWNRENPNGIKEVVQSDTDFDFVLYRTQLFNPVDIDNLRWIQAGYKIETFRSFSAGQPRHQRPLSSFQSR
jgi:hypothetical protein